MERKDGEDRFDTAKPYHQGLLKLELKAIKNSTRTDAIADEMRTATRITAVKVTDRVRRWASNYGHQWLRPHGWSSKGVYRTFNRWHHTASYLQQQPTYQYLPHGK
ncbi:unnamed protein product [Orchesella dallaii]|uniref:Uncharacterized protein n=1 Tax=Orchesella dallaii TaxID=48710 RepID=A0ABP1PZ99_9HEXA